MNTSRVAEIHRQLAKLHDELADELERGDAPKNTNAAPPKKPRRKRVRKPFVPSRPFSEIEIERARHRARKLGIATG
jgi:hypothetical protein